MNKAELTDAIAADTGKKSTGRIDYMLIGYYPQMISYSAIKKFLLVGPLFFDYVGKLIVGFFLYQFITAFSKYAKR